MTQRVAEQRSTHLGLGIQADFPDDEGELVGDEELFEPDEPVRPPSFDPVGRFSPRYSQLVPRGALRTGAQREELLGRYRIERIVGKTAHEVSARAVHLDLSRRVLLRYLTPLASRSPEAVARFQRGARKARELGSEHAERLVELGRLASGSPYRAVELPNGPSLAEILRVRGALPISEAVDIVLAACDPVSEAHASGSVHRSLNPSNIFVERRVDGTALVRVLDFGVTDPLEPDWTSSDADPVPAAALGVDLLRYASPEQIRTPSEVDARADVWALGAILYELIAGTPVFHADNALTLLAMIAADHPPPLGLLRTDVPAEVEQLVLRCLEKDPEARPRSVLELVLALTPFASPDGRVGAAHLPRVVTRTSRPPPLLSHGPSWPAQSQSRALVRTRQPTLVDTAPPRTNLRDFGFLFAGAGIGLGAAMFGLFLARSSPPVVPTVAAQAPATIASAPTPAPQVPAVASIPLAPVAAPLVTAPRAPAAVVAAPARSAAEQPARPRAERPLPRAGEALAPVAAPKADAPPKTNSQRQAAAEALFGGMD